MPKSSGKIATCCYCGRRTTLVLAGEAHHELACAACGAPLHEMKSLPVETLNAPTAKAQTRPRPAPHQLFQAPETRKKKKAKKKRRKSLGKRVASELFDFLDDVFD